MLHKLLLGIGGIYSAYITMSILSQRLYNTPYPSIDNPSTPGKFEYPPIIIWFGALLCTIAGSIISFFIKDGKNPIPFHQQIILGGLYMTNISATNYALMYISYPVQVIGRNTRLLFVVIIGAFFSRVKDKDTHIRLGKHKIFMAIVITVGVLLFNFAKGPKDKGDKHDPKLEWIGYILLTISVIADALFSDSQAYSKANYKPTGNQLFTITNFYLFIFSLLFSLFVDQSFFSSINFLRSHPSVLIDLAGIGFLQVFGQISVYYVVANFKQHMFPLISTTRKMITILVSIFLFNHTVNQWQWVAIGLVFVGMFYQLYQEIIPTPQATASDKNSSLQKQKDKSQ